jgi:hypothetical protein
MPNRFYVSEYGYSSIYIITPKYVLHSLHVDIFSFSLDCVNRHQVYRLEKDLSPYITFGRAFVGGRRRVVQPPQAAESKGRQN